MTREKALGVLNLPLEATDADIEEKFFELTENLDFRIKNAPTRAIAETYQKNKESIEAAYRFLQTGELETDDLEYPIVEPVDPEKGIVEDSNSDEETLLIPDEDQIDLPVVQPVDDEIDELADIPESLPTFWQRYQKVLIAIGAIAGILVMITTFLFWDYLRGQPGVYMLWFASKNSFITESMVVNNPMTAEWQTDSITIRGPYSWWDFVVQGNDSYRIIKTVYPGTKLDFYEHLDSLQTNTSEVP